MIATPAPVILADNDALNRDFPLRPFAIRHKLAGHDLLTLPRIAKLAQDLRATYPSSSLDASVYDNTQNGFGTILRRSVLTNTEATDLSHMPLGAGRFGAGYDITTDE